MVMIRAVQLGNGDVDDYGGLTTKRQEDSGGWALKGRPSHRKPPVIALTAYVSTLTTTTLAGVIEVARCASAAGSNVEDALFEKMDSRDVEGWIVEVVIGVQLAARVTSSGEEGSSLQIVSSTLSSNTMDSMSETSHLDQTCALYNEDEGKGEIDDDIVR